MNNQTNHDATSHYTLGSKSKRKLVTLPLATCEVKTEYNQTISLTLSPDWADGVALTHYLKL